MLTNVIQMTPRGGDPNVLDQIERYLQNKGNKSERTKESYARDIKEFFKEIRKKEISQLSREDVQLKIDDFEDFINKKLDEGQLNNKTINRCVGTVKTLLKYLNSKGIVDDISFLLNGSIVRLPEVKNKYGALTVAEVNELAELALHEREKGEIKRLYFLFLLETCARKTAAMNMKWSNFTEINENDVTLRYIDKGNKEFKIKIARWLYNELLTLKVEGEERVFNLSENAIQNSFTRIKKKMNIREERNIVIHSIRKCGATFLFYKTNNILFVQKVLGHTNVNVTQDYIDVQDYGVIGAVSTAGEVGVEIINEVSHEELLAAINSLPKDNQLLLALKIQELNQNLSQ